LNSLRHSGRMQGRGERQALLAGNPARISQPDSCRSRRSAWGRKYPFGEWPMNAALVARRVKLGQLLPITFRSIAAQARTAAAALSLPPRSAVLASRRESADAADGRRGRCGPAGVSADRCAEFGNSWAVGHSNRGHFFYINLLGARLIAIARPTPVLVRGQRGNS